jgi:hypothetical protein
MLSAGNNSLWIVAIERGPDAVIRDTPLGLTFLVVQIWPSSLLDQKDILEDLVSL